MPVRRRRGWLLASIVVLLLEVAFIVAVHADPFLIILVGPFYLIGLLVLAVLLVPLVRARQWATCAGCAVGLAMTTTPAAIFFGPPSLAHALSFARWKAAAIFDEATCQGAACRATRTIDASEESSIGGECEYIFFHLSEDDRQPAKVADYAHTAMSGFDTYSDAEDIGRGYMVANACSP